MYTVGVISETTLCKTFMFNTLEEAEKDILQWKKSFLVNNDVEKYLTISDRDGSDNLISLRFVFTVRYNTEKIIMFLQKNE